MYEKMVLPNGVRILTEPVSGVRSAALGFWVGSGSRHERAEENGAAHFIEHMLFKGTRRRTAAQLAEDMDAIGGQVNAFTTRESTCFYARALDTQLPRASDILCDMFFSSRFSEEDVQTERGVILEEIGMYEDNPEDLSAELLAREIYRGSALARPILGREATLKRMTGEWLKGYKEAHYLPGDIVVALSGSYTRADVEELKERFSALGGGALPKPRKAVYHAAVAVRSKDIEQNHLTLAFPGLPYGDRRRYALQLLSAILGGGMSSRLWQEVREKRGLCYSIYSYGAGHAEVGALCVYTATSPETEGEALRAIRTVTRELRERGVSEAELSRAREQSKANVLMALESTQARMSNLGRGELLTGQVLGPEEIIAAYDAVTAEEVQALAEELLDFRKASLSAVGQVGEKELYRAFLQSEQ